MEPYILFYSKIPEDEMQNKQQNNNVELLKRKFANGASSSGTFIRTFKPFNSFSKTNISKKIFFR